MRFFVHVDFFLFLVKYGTGNSVLIDKLFELGGLEFLKLIQLNPVFSEIPVPSNGVRQNSQYRYHVPFCTNKETKSRSPSTKGDFVKIFA